MDTINHRIGTLTLLIVSETLLTKKYGIGIPVGQPNIWRKGPKENDYHKKCESKKSIPIFK